MPASRNDWQNRKFALSFSNLLDKIFETLERIPPARRRENIFFTRGVNFIFKSKLFRMTNFLINLSKSLNSAGGLFLRIDDFEVCNAKLILRQAKTYRLITNFGNYVICLRLKG